MIRAASFGSALFPHAGCNQSSGTGRQCGGSGGFPTAWPVRTPSPDVAYSDRRDLDGRPWPGCWCAECDTDGAQYISRGDRRSARSASRTRPPAVPPPAAAKAAVVAHACRRSCANPLAAGSGGSSRVSSLTTDAAASIPPDGGLSARSLSYPKALHHIRLRAPGFVSCNKESLC
jgi:hypothetical protein